MPSTATVSNYYRGFPPPVASLYAAAESKVRSSYGNVERYLVVSDRNLCPLERSAGSRLTLGVDDAICEGGGADTTAAMVTETDSNTSGEDEDVSVCSLDVTSSPADVADTSVLIAPQIEAS